MTNPTPTLSPWTLWAKWTSDEKGTWHPLLCHLTDVAMCAEAMWDSVLSPAWKRRLADALGLPEPAARAWVIYLTGLHDLGKACPGFQLQLHPKYPVAHAHIQQRLRTAGLLVVAECPWVGHGIVSALALRDYLPARFGFSYAVANAFAIAVGGHHGYFPSDSDVAALPDDSLGGASWRAARIQYADWFADLIAPPAATPPTSCAHEASVMFAGFVSVVDWIGSSETIFEHAVPTPDGVPDHDLPTYRDHARAQARYALKTLGWIGWEPSTASLSFEDMFPACLPPRPVQRAAIDLAQTFSALSDHPGLIIIEEQMGEGKTEAAAYLADTWATRFGQTGVYFALPTQATSNQMFERIHAFLAHRYPEDLVNLQLLHGHAALSDILRSFQDEARARLLDLASVQDTEDGHPQDGAVIAATWFASGKRALLAPFGVGTVDQALLAALQVKHFFVRLYGLSTKTVIIDEVHAYDTYMSQVIERLLTWLGALRVPVILLSATLPSSRRQRLLNAYRSATVSQTTSQTTSQTATNQADAAPLPAASQTPYPRITWTSATSGRASVGARAIPVDPARQRTVQLEWINGRLPAINEPNTPPEPFALGERLQRDLADGGCCVIICNTVRRAQAVYTALKPWFPGLASDNLPRLDLFHARYPQRDRAEREKRSLTRFGNDGKGGKDGTRPDTAVLVATQVVEQSLDLDFDLMVTDHAPVDLLLQRSGRLHRHAGRTRPPRLRDPRLLLVAPDAIADGGVPAFDRGSATVYEEHILLTSWLALRDLAGGQPSAQLHIPRDIEPLVEAVYEESEDSETSGRLASLSPELQDAWIESRALMRKHQSDDAAEAQNRYIWPPNPAIALADISPYPKAEDRPDLHPKRQALTRLTGPTISVVCLYAPSGEVVATATGRTDRTGRTDANQPLLDPDGPRVSLTAKPDHATVVKLLERSLTLADSRVVYTLLDQSPPSGWAKTSLLCQHRCLIFDANGLATVGKYTIRLDPELGLVIESTQ